MTLGWGGVFYSINPTVNRLLRGIWAFAGRNYINSSILSDQIFFPKLFFIHLENKVWKALYCHGE